MPDLEFYRRQKLREESCTLKVSKLPPLLYAGLGWPHINKVIQIVLLEQSHSYMLYGNSSTHISSRDLHLLENSCADSPI